VIALGTVSHPNIVNLLGVSVQTPKADGEGVRCLLYELCTGGSLADRLTLSAPSEFDKFVLPFPWHERVRVLIDTCLGLACLHECSLLHCDIKPDNILIREDGSAAVADFGLSRSIAFQSVGGHGHTPGYDDPHWKYDRSFTTESDIYALGMVMLQVLMRKGAKDIRKYCKDILPKRMAYREEWATLKGAITSGGLQVEAEWPEDVADALTMLALRCRTTFPELRPGIGECLAKLSDIANKPVAFEMWPTLSEAEEALRSSACPEDARRWGASLREKMEKIQEGRAKEHLIRQKVVLEAQLASGESNPGSNPPPMTEEGHRRNREKFQVVSDLRAPTTNEWDMRALSTGAGGLSSLRSPSTGLNTIRQDPPLPPLGGVNENEVSMEGPYKGLSPFKREYACAAPYGDLSGFTMPSAEAVSQAVSELQGRCSPPTQQMLHQLNASRPTRAEKAACLEARRNRTSMIILSCQSSPQNTAVSANSELPELPGKAAP